MQIFKDKKRPKDEDIIKCLDKLAKVVGELSDKVIELETRQNIVVEYLEDVEKEIKYIETKL